MGAGPLSALICASILLAGCSPSDSHHDDGLAKIISAPPENVPYRIKTPSLNYGHFSTAALKEHAAITFDGERKEVFETSIVPANFIFDFAIITTPGYRTGQADNITPSMPMVSNSFALYLTETGYFIHGGVLDHIQLLCSPVELNRIVVINVEDGAVVLLNGEEAWRGPRLRRMSELTLGAGFAQRSWAGGVQRAVFSQIPDHTTLAKALTLSSQADLRPLYELTQ